MPIVFVSRRWRPPALVCQLLDELSNEVFYLDKRVSNAMRDDLAQARP
jgi:hypothetical protein